MPVPSSKVHMDHVRGDPAVKYAKTSKIGNTTIHVVAPPPMTDERLEQIEKEIHAAAWEIIRELEEKKQSAAKGEGGEKEREV